LLYLPKQNYILSGSYDYSISVISLYEAKIIKKLSYHNNIISSLVCLDDERFASSCLEVIKIWSLNSDIESTKTIKAHEECGEYIVLKSLSNDFIISYAGDEFRVWHAKNYECLKIYKEDKTICTIITSEKNNRYDLVIQTIDKE
jgi:WD40 repeat protein